MKPLLGALLALALLTPSAARAGDAYEARFLDGWARQAFAAQHYEEAFEAFARVYAIIPAPATLYNMALAADRAGDVELAFAHFTEYLAVEPDSEAHRRDAARRLAELRTRLALLHVESSEDGAQIFLDRRELGSVGRTPRTFIAEPGAHRVMLSMPGYHDAEVAAVAERGRQRSLALTLVPRTGSVRVDATPSDAQVVVLRGGAEVWGGAAGAAVELPVGRYRLRLVAPGYRTLERRLRVQEGRTLHFQLAPRALPRIVGRLLVASGDVPATLVVDGEPRAETPVRLDDVPVGTHRIELRASGYVAWSRTVEIDPAQPTLVEVTLVRAP